SHSSSMRKAGSGLVRQDSARWSDRFFEASEDDSDEEDYLTSTAKVKNKRMSRPINADVSQPAIFDVLTQSPKEDTRSLSVNPEPQPLNGTKGEAEGPSSG